MYRELLDKLTEFVATDAGNIVSADDAINEDVIGLRMFEAPLLAVGDAADPLFAELKNDRVIHHDYPSPQDWQPGAKRILSYFLPFTQRVKASNGIDPARSSPEWYHSRIEGQDFVNKVGQYLCRLLQEKGFAATYPAADARFKLFHPYASNWSERHTAFICGIGTFGASKGIITPKGIAGRLGSVLTTCGDIEITPRKYTELYEYCSQCGACARRCPVQAIDLSRGMHLAKDHTLCGPYVGNSKTEPQGKSGKQRIGCGKCQVQVPCSDGIPVRSKKV